MYLLCLFGVRVCTLLIVVCVWLLAVFLVCLKCVRFCFYSQCCLTMFCVVLALCFVWLFVFLLSLHFLGVVGRCFRFVWFICVLFVFVCLDACVIVFL